MCQFCIKHGEGKKWYLQAKNYSEDMLSDIRRRRLIEKFLSHPDVIERGFERVSRLNKTPRIIRDISRTLLTRKMKKLHFGQVVPMEDIEEIFELVNSVVRVACLCRHISLNEEKRYCYGISLGSDGGQLAGIIRGVDKSFLSGPNGVGLETISKQEALSALRKHEREGLCHTIWTFRTPFIGAICNCDRADCLAMRSTLIHSVPVMFRAEYVAEVDPNLCVGCRECMRVCQFGAVAYSASTGKAVIAAECCYGCGVCRSVCEKGAIRLQERAEVPVAADLW